MAMSVRYSVFDEEIVEENRNGTIRDYLPDAIGSTVALLDNSQVRIDTFTYWPYGEIKSRTGATATPFQFMGSDGLYSDGESNRLLEDSYYLAKFGRWLTPESPYIFAGNNPTSLLQRGGSGTITKPGRSPGSERAPSRHPKTGSPAPPRSFPGSFILRGGLLVSLLLVPCNSPTSEDEIIQRMNDDFRVRPERERVRREWAKKHRKRKKRKDGCPPPDPPVVRVDRGNHYFKKLGCCCMGLHTHIITYHRGPPPECPQQGKEVAGTCYDDCVPGPCPGRGSH